MIDILTSEIYHFKQHYPFLKKFKFDNRKIMDKVEIWRAKGYSLAKIKRLIREELRDLYFWIFNEITKISKQQIKNIGIKEDLKPIPFQNLTLKEILDGRKNTHFRDLIQDNINKNDAQRRAVRGITGLTDTHLKNQRENAYNHLDPTKKPKGWLSKAILDSRTSAICISLHNRYYPISDRSRVPNQPPRHQNCRSSLLPIYELSEVKDKQGENLKSWLKDNPKIGKDLLGIKKYELVMKNKLEMRSFVDLKNGKYYTNKEIEDRLK